MAILLIASSPAWSQGQSHGKLFPPSDLGLLEAPDRDLWQRPDQVMDAMGIADASVVADIGAGSGWFTIRLARRVGPQGLVYAEDVQTEMINAITRRVQRESLTNVKAVRRLTRRRAGGRCVSRNRRPRDDAGQPRAGAQAARPDRRRGLQAGWHRARAVDR
jgi:hypothetical protein